MGSERWALIKSHKFFYVHVYRRAVWYLIISLMLSMILTCLIYYQYINQPERDYYATSGIVPPEQLQARTEPNHSSQPLLEPDPPIEIITKTIPQ